jgi:dethiobiotin synthetase/adenosylmethionine--8-amino-7-oxononanoate aminotransferase
MDAAAASDNLTSFFQNGHGNEPQVVNEEDAIGDIMSFLNRHVPEPGQDGGWLFIELLGGVMTPCFTGPPQADVYQPLGFPVVFVGSSALNGVSLTISTFESLALRGYNVIAVVMFKEETWKHYRYVEQYFRRSHPSVPVVILPALPLAWRPNAVEAVREYYNGVYASGAVSQLVSWLDAVYQ